MLQTKFIEKIKTHILWSIFFLERAVFEITWKNMVEPDRLMISNFTDTHSEYVILIAFPWQQWLGERPLMLWCTYT
jgi:hypothetical protein